MKDMKYTINLWITAIVMLTTTAFRANDLTALMGSEPIDTVKKEAGDDVIMRQHLTEGGTPA